MFMRVKRKSFAFNISSVANQRVPTILARIPRQVEPRLPPQQNLNPLLSEPFSRPATSFSGSFPTLLPATEHGFYVIQFEGAIGS